MPLSVTLSSRAAAIDGHANAELGIAREQLGAREAFEPQPVVGVGSVGDQLAQEDLPLAVQRVHHEVQQLLDLGLKRESGRPAVLHWRPDATAQRMGARLGASWVFSSRGR